MLTGLAVGAGAVACRKAAPPDLEPERWFSRIPADRQRALEAAVERVLPGAVAAGAMAYITYWLARPPYIGSQKEFDTAALLLNREAQKRYRKLFPDLAGAEQDAILRAFQGGEIKGKHFDSQGFWQRLMTLTLESFLAEPKYGGNRNEVGWQLIGWHRCHFAPRRTLSLSPPRPKLPY